MDPRYLPVLWFGYHDVYGGYCYQTAGGMFLLSYDYPF